MKHSVPHDLGREKAKTVAERALDSYAKRFAEYNPSVSWTSDNHANIGFKAKGVSLSGSLTVEEKSIDMDLEVPFLLRPFKGKALSIIEEEIRKWVAKAKQGEV